MAAEEGFMLPQHKKASKKLLETGHAVPIDDANQEIRKELEIGEIPPTVHSSDEALEQVQAIMKKTGFEELILGKKKEGEE
jgi:heterodisulfide reductase subunit C